MFFLSDLTALLDQSRVHYLVMSGLGTHKIYLDKLPAAKIYNKTRAFEMQYIRYGRARVKYRPCLVKIYDLAVAEPYAEIRIRRKKKKH